MRLVYSKTASKDLNNLNPRLALRILNKLEWFLNTTHPLSFAKPLANMSPATHRFRIGDYRAIIEAKTEKGEIWILSIKHRKEIYN
ncbi:type II toxin-antitoxin system RelE/ParE family toxin [Candidatus Peregrinibacteria bacterium]|nr:type II toxin-antitoxin system RelE/ParE family toxin [Candidatus Peregrinibacteria bacterium]